MPQCKPQKKKEKSNWSGPSKGLAFLNSLNHWPPLTKPGSQQTQGKKWGKELPIRTQLSGRRGRPGSSPGPGRAERLPHLYLLSFCHLNMVMSQARSHLWESWYYWGVLTISKGQLNIGEQRAKERGTNFWLFSGIWVGFEGQWLSPIRSLWPHDRSQPAASSWREESRCLLGGRLHWSTSLTRTLWGWYWGLHFTTSKSPIALCG